MAGLADYLTDDEQAIQQQYLMDALSEELPAISMATANPASQVQVPQAMVQGDLAQLYDQKMREANLQEQAGIGQLEQYIKDYQQAPRKVDFTPLAALFGDQNLMQAAQSMRPESEEQKMANVMALQQRLQDARHKVSGGTLQALAAQLRMSQAAQAEAERRRQSDQRIAMEKQRSDAWEAAKQMELALRERELASRSQDRFDRQNEANRRHEESLNEKKDARFESDTQKLEKRIGDMVPGIVKKLQNLDDMIPGGIEGAGDVPGAGPGKFLIPDVMLSNEASEVQQNARGLMADLIKLQSGTAASDQEVARKMKERGMGPGSKPETFRSGLRLLRDELVTAVKNKQAGFRPEVIEKYKSREGLTYDTIEAVGKHKPKISFDEWKKAKGL